MPDRKITIEDHMQLSKAQELFNAAFPFLRIEFFPAETEPSPLTRRKIHPATTFALFRKNNVKEPITITPNMTVSELDRNFNTVYGLETQIFRKSGKIWLETTLTEQWTLDEQNLQGKALSS
jgi:hypothetical protein